MQRRSTIAFLMTLPLIILIVTLVAYPAGYAVYLAMLNKGMTRFVGLGNFDFLFGRETFWMVVYQSCLFAITAVIFKAIIGFVVAHFVHNIPSKGQRKWRGMLLVPWVIPPAMSTLAWLWLFDPSYSAFNWLLEHVGLDRISWLGETGWARFSVILANVWFGAPFFMIMYLASLKSVPEQLYEAASIDGARPMRQFLHITVPMLRPTIIFTVVISTIGGLQLFTEPYLFEPLHYGATGGSDRQYQTVAMYLYEKAFASSQFKFGYASAAAWCLFLLIAVISAINFLIVRRIRSAE